MAVTVLRLTDPDRWALLRDVRLAALSDAPEAFGSTLERESDFDETQWRERAGAGTHLVALDGGAAVGLVAGIQPDGSPADELHLVSMWVAPSRRGGGVGRELVERLFADARDDGHREVTLWVRRENAAARAAYRTWGFIEADIPEYMRENACSQEVFMRRTLTEPG